MADYFLAIESSSTNCSVGLFSEDDLIANKDFNEGYSHSESLATMVNDILQSNALSMHDISALAVGEGPGSYTGLRIGVAFAKGLCYQSNTHLISFNSLDSMMLQIINNNLINVMNDSILISAVDARRDEVYCRVYDVTGKPLSNTCPKVIDSQSFTEYSKYNQVIVFGSGAEKIKRLTQIGETLVCLPGVFPSVLALGKLVHSKFNLGQYEDVAYFEPFYLKEFNAGKPKKNILIP